MQPFCLNLNTEIRCENATVPMQNAIAILQRDMKKTLIACPDASNSIELTWDSAIPGEGYILETEGQAHIRIRANDELGFVYALLYISEEYLGIQPFWFWLDQDIPMLGRVNIPAGVYKAREPRVRFRGWFLNDEVLIMRWDTGFGDSFPWKMAFEALLRSGGNMVIPGTDKSSRRYRGLAAEYGLWITHHHAEPLGAEMFARAYPDLTPSYLENPEAFESLWEQAVLEQKSYKTVWALGFRGQGDCPFWEGGGEEIFNTPEKQGKHISDLIELQRQIICKHIEQPVLCTNLYGEVMELYNDGHISLHPDIIKVWADNGFGKMVTRRRGNLCARVRSLPQQNDGSANGVYYHISFHDLQAASHITTLPNTVDFVNEALREAVELGVDDYWIINSSNVRPHAYYLDALRKLWFGETVSDATHSREYAKTYYDGDDGVAACLAEYAASLPSYGPHEDQNAGEQFYNYCVRHLARQFVVDKQAGCRQLYWLAGEIPLYAQAKEVLRINQDGFDKLDAYYNRCRKVSETLCGRLKKLFDSTVLLQARIHQECCMGTILFCRALIEAEQEEYQRAFYLAGCAAQGFSRADASMRDSEYGIWKGFYENDCLTDIKFTAYVIESTMRVLRMLGDDVRFAEWYEDYMRTKADRNVRLLSITHNHMTDDELFQAMQLAAVPPVVAE